jgi:hypothetical protein
MTRSSGLICRAAPKSRALAWLCAPLVYAALWAALCSMASLSTLGLAPLSVGACLALLLALPQRNSIRFGAAALVALAALALLLRSDAQDGIRLLCNRLFAASEAQQAYQYDKFSVAAAEADWPRCLRAALLPCGMLTGALAGVMGSGFAALFVPLAGLAAYLGVAPAPIWCALLAVALIFALAQPFGGLGGAIPCCIAAALLCAAVWLIFPNEDVRLSAWDEQARDTLALQTMAYTSAAQTAQTPEATEEERQLYRDESESSDLGGDDADLEQPNPIWLVIAAAALILFLPAIAADLQKRRRAKHRAALTDPDDRVAVRAMFLYALRWFRLGGLAVRNAPHSDYAPQLETAYSPALRTSFDAVLPLWQAAAYSPHAPSDAARAQMQQFLTDAEAAVWEKLSRRQRFLAKYYYAL